MPTVALDSHHGMRALMTHLIQEHGFQRFAVIGEAALALMAIEIPALVQLDLVMPGLGGAEVLDRMRADPRLARFPW